MLKKTVAVLFASFSLLSCIPQPSPRTEPRDTPDPNCASACRVRGEIVALDKAQSREEDKRCFRGDDPDMLSCISACEGQETNRPGSTGATCVGAIEVGNDAVAACEKVQGCRRR